MTILALLTGVTIGILAYDLRARSKDRKNLLVAQKEAEEASKKLGELHNAQVLQIKEIIEKVNSHDNYLKAVTGDANKHGMKRF